MKLDVIKGEPYTVFNCNNGHGAILDPDPESKDEHKCPTCGVRMERFVMQ